MKDPRDPLAALELARGATKRISVASIFTRPTPASPQLSCGLFSCRIKRNGFIVFRWRGFYPDPEFYYSLVCLPSFRFVFPEFSRAPPILEQHSPDRASPDAVRFMRLLCKETSWSHWPFYSSRLASPSWPESIVLSSACIFSSSLELLAARLSAVIRRLERFLIFAGKHRLFHICTYLFNVMDEPEATAADSPSTQLIVKSESRDFFEVSFIVMMMAIRDRSSWLAGR